MKKYWLLALIGISFLSQSAFAFNQPNQLTFTAGGGYYFFNKRNLKNVDMPNAALSYNFNEHWAGEFGVGVINADSRDTTITQNVHGYLYSINGIYRLCTRCNYQPYFIGGVGVLAIKPRTNVAENKYQSNIQAGFGTQVFYHSNIALRGEVRDVYTMNGGKNEMLANFGISFLFC